jgi:DNA-cytosine methyltransferase
VDTTSTTHISLCSGYGGIDLGLKRVLQSLRTIAYAEIEAFAVECLLARMEGGQIDAAPIWSDLKSFPWGAFSGMVDILSGGYPCQPFSTAGKRSGAADSRHLWPYIAAGVRVLRPKMCFFENVEGHITLGLSTVISDLEEMGYSVSWGIFSAAECGATHKRKRVFVLADSNSQGSQGYRRFIKEYDSKKRQNKTRYTWPSGIHQYQKQWEPQRYIEPKMGGDFNGPTGGLDYANLCVSCDNRTDELRLLGNGVVPATAELAFRNLLNSQFFV